MNQSRFILAKFSVILAITLGLSSINFPVQGQTEFGRVQSSSKKSLLIFPPLQKKDQGNEGRPTHRTSGGGRGDDCLELIALVPGEGKIELYDGECDPNSKGRPQSSLAHTVEEFPSLWFYIPESPEFRTIEAELKLVDEQKTLLSEQRFLLSQNYGVIEIPLTYSLQPNQKYRWIFSLLIDSDNRSENPQVEGWLKRVPETKTTCQLKAESSEWDCITHYVNNSIWHDALTALAKLRREAPQDKALEAQWSSLLSSVGLEAITEVPINDCCSLDK